MPLFVVNHEFGTVYVVAESYSDVLPTWRTKLLNDGGSVVVGNLKPPSSVRHVLSDKLLVVSKQYTNVFGPTVLEMTNTDERDRTMNKEMEPNLHTHFYLYAKGHYERTDVTNDTRRILAEYAAIEFKYTKLADVLEVLLPVAWKHIEEKGYHHFNEFVKMLSPHYYGRRSEEYQVRCVSACLSVLANTKVKGLNLGAADPKILPLCKDE